jgi:hypothetical protein
VNYHYSSLIGAHDWIFGRQPPQGGFPTSLIGGMVEFYLGRHPASGGSSLKLVFPCCLVELGVRWFICKEHWNAGAIASAIQAAQLERRACSG